MPVGLLFAADPVTAGGQAMVVEDEGIFDGHNPKTGNLWVSDHVYQYTVKLKVVGTSKKAGLLSDIRRGEPVFVTYMKRQGQVPLAVEIRRK
jgi:hypothetical protein